MTWQFRAGSAVSLFIGVALIAASRLLEADVQLPFFRKPIVAIVEGVGQGLAAFGVLVLVASFTPWFRREGPQRTACDERPYWTLFIVSFAALFVELMLIRYCGSQIRVFSFYKNIPLIAAFLGLGLGSTRRGGGSRHALLFLLWLVPLAAFLSAGSLAVSEALGRHAAIGTSEQILGDFVPTDPDRSRQWVSQLWMTGFCLGTFVAIALLFNFVGRLLGEAFHRVERLPGYTVNIVGSLAGILTFVGLSYLQTPPWVWFAVGLLPFLWWLSGGRWIAAALVLGLASVAAVTPDYGDTVWSPYQKLVGHEAVAGSGGGSVYLVEISDVFYQGAVDRRPEVLARTRFDPMPHYDALYRHLPQPERVLIVGAGTGNDVAAALRAGASHVDAVDIDPAIVEFGRRHHPERPYDDPRAHVIVDDARHVFRTQEAGSYDVVVFGLLDSHTQLGISSVRLDNYVFTQESFKEAANLLRPGGHVVVTAATFESWFRDRLREMLHRAVGTPVAVLDHGAWKSYVARVGPLVTAGEPTATSTMTLPTDDWPFLYLPRRQVPPVYLWVVASLALVSVLVLRLGGLTLRAWSRQHTHLFFLGAGFLLMEVHAINRLALLFGTTWLVSGITIAIVLLLIVAANLTVMRLPALPYPVAYLGLALALGVSFWLQPSLVVGRGAGAELVWGLVMLSPVYFAGLVFGRSFRLVEQAAPAIGANILGSVLGGWVEYATMAVGIRALVLLAAVFYALSLLGLKRSTGHPTQ